MSLIKSLRYLCIVASLLVLACSASAQIDLGPQHGSLSSSSQLNLTATIPTAIQIDISTASGLDPASLRRAMAPITQEGQGGLLLPQTQPPASKPVIGAGG